MKGIKLEIFCTLWPHFKEKFIFWQGWKKISSLFQLYEEGEIQGTIAELMTEQVEFSNVVIMNKQDMVSEEQQLDILDRIHLLNPKAKVLKSKQSKVDVKEILNTHLYSR